MSRYIDADKLKIVYASKDVEKYADAFNKLVDAIPTADVRENVKGEWIADELTGWLCSNCGEHIVLDIRMHGNFCPNCGARMMRGGDAE
jgi:DNA-directed RNA polymerase subunit RPC12/RpoP